MDKHKINFVQRQLHPTMIGLMDLLESSKDVGQNGVISPWADLTEFAKNDKNKFPNIKYDLFKYIQDTFDDDRVRFNCDSIEEFNEILDILVASSTIDLNYKVKPEDFTDGEKR